MNHNKKECSKNQIQLNKEVNFAWTSLLVILSKLLTNHDNFKKESMLYQHS